MKLNSKKSYLAASIFTFILLLSVNIPGKDNKPAANPQEYPEDSLGVMIQEKITLYQSEQKKNNEAILSLQNELDQRRVLNERLSGAISAAQEILFIINEKSDSGGGGQEASRQ